MDDDNGANESNQWAEEARRVDKAFFSWRIEEAMARQNADWLIALVAYWLQFHGLRVSDEALSMLLHFQDLPKRGEW